MPQANLNTSGLKPPWEPGQSGNPSGRPRKRPVTDEYFQVLTEPVPEKIRLQINAQMGEEILPTGATWGRAQALRRAMDALLKDGHPASKEMREAIEGKAPMRIEIQGTQRKEVIFRFIEETRLIVSSE